MRSRTVERYPLDSFIVPEGRRAINEKAMEPLMKSMGALGLRTPITARYTEEPTLDPETGTTVHGCLILITGRHRYEAAKRLGWDEIDCFVDDLSPEDAELWEHHENLCRAELTPAEQAEAIAACKRIFDAKPGQVGQVSGGRGNKGFAKETEEATGVDQRTINRAVARGEKIAPEVLAEVKGTDDDKGVVLDRLARQQGEDAQRAELARIQSERAARRRDNHAADNDAREDAAEQLALLLSEHIPAERHAVLLAWLHAAKTADVVRHFRAINGAVFDATDAARAA